MYHGGDAARTDLMTITRYVLNEQSKHPEFRGDFTILLSHIVLGCKFVCSAVNKTGLAKLIGLSGETNVQGEEQKKLDVLSNEVFIKALVSSSRTCILVSEEDEEATIVGPSKCGEYYIVFDPLDGSSNIDCSVSIGTIFGIYMMKDGHDPTVEDVLQPGKDMLAAGYCMYGSSCTLVLSTGTGVNGFTLDPSLGEFILTHPNIKIPKKGKIYSVNEGNAKNWYGPTSKYVQKCKFPDEGSSPKSLRYIGSMVADVHRTLLYGGIFLYPADKICPNGKLRVLYEVFPMSFLMEQAPPVFGKRSLFLSPLSWNVVCCSYDWSRILSTSILLTCCGNSLYSEFGRQLIVGGKSNRFNVIVVLNGGVPIDVLLATVWTCAGNIWNQSRCSCSAPDGLYPQELETLVRLYTEFKRRKLDAALRLGQENEPGLDAVMVGDSAGDLSTISIATATKHPRHRAGCSCIVCIQPPSGKGKHKPTCDCNVCMTVKCRFKTMMMRKKKRQSEREAELAQRKIVSVAKDGIEVDSSPRNTSTQLYSQILVTHMARREKIDLNFQPERDRNLKLVLDRTSMINLVREASQPLEAYMKQNSLVSLVAGRDEGQDTNEVGDGQLLPDDCHSEEDVREKDGGGKNDDDDDGVDESSIPQQSKSTSH